MIIDHPLASLFDETEMGEDQEFDVVDLWLVTTPSDELLNGIWRGIYVCDSVSQSIDTSSNGDSENIVTPDDDDFDWYYGGCNCSNADDLLDSECLGNRHRGP